MKTTFHSSLRNDDVQTSASHVIGAAKVFDAFGNKLAATGAWKFQFGYPGKFGYTKPISRHSNTKKFALCGGFKFKFVAAAVGIEPTTR